MQVFADPVSHEVPYDGEPRSLDMALDRCGHVVQMIPGPRLRNPQEERLFRHAQEPRLLRRRSDREGDRGVGFDGVPERRRHGTPPGRVDAQHADSWCVGEEGRSLVGGHAEIHGRQPFLMSVTRSC